MIRKMLYTSLLLFVCSFAAHAAVNAFDFNDEAKEKRFKQLSEELRCLVCQNQSLADSGAGLAMDLKKELFKQVMRNASDEEIKTFMVSRYGDFVLYSPPIKTSTYLLWFGPFVFAVIALFALLRMIRRTSREHTDTLSAADHQRAQQLLAEKKE